MFGKKRNNNEQYPTLYDSNGSIISGPKNAFPIEVEEKRPTNPYEYKQLRIQRGMLFTQLGLVVFGLIGIGINLWQTSVAQESADTADKSVLLAQKSERDSERSGIVQEHRAENIRKFTEKSTKIQLSLLQTQVQMAERPLVIVSGFGVFSFSEAKESPVAGNALLANITYINLGKSPALGVKVIRHIYFGRQFAENIHPSVFVDDGLDDLAPGRPSTVSVVSLKVENKKDQFFVDPANVLAWDGKAFPIVVYGEIFYHDRFKNFYCEPILEISFDGKIYATPGQIGPQRTSDLCPKDSIR